MATDAPLTSDMLYCPYVNDDAQCIQFVSPFDLILDLRNKVNYNFLDLKYGLSFSLWLYHCHFQRIRLDALTMGLLRRLLLSALKIITR